VERLDDDPFGGVGTLTGAASSRYAGIADVSLVLDSSLFDPDDVTYMRQVAAALTLELDIWSIDQGQKEEKVTDMGSRMEVSEGRFGKVQHDTTTLSRNPSEMACRILADQWLSMMPGGAGDLDPATALAAAASRIAERRHRDLVSGHSLGKAQVVVMMFFGSLSLCFF